MTLVTILYIVIFQFENECQTVSACVLFYLYIRYLCVAGTLEIDSKGDVVNKVAGGNNEGLNVKTADHFVGGVPESYDRTKLVNPIHQQNGADTTELCVINEGARSAHLTYRS